MNGFSGTKGPELIHDAMAQCDKIIIGLGSLSGVLHIFTREHCVVDYFSSKAT